MSRYRSLVVPLAVIAAAVLFYMQNPWFSPGPGTTERTVATVAFWVLAIVVLVLMFEDRTSPDAQTVEVEGPTFARYLFSNTRAGLFWLPIRIFLGFEWIEAGWHKLTGGEFLLLVRGDLDSLLQAVLERLDLGLLLSELLLQLRDVRLGRCGLDGVDNLMGLPVEGLPGLLAVARHSGDVTILAE